MWAGRINFGATHLAGTWPAHLGVLAGFAIRSQGELRPQGPVGVSAAIHFRGVEEFRTP